MARVGDVLFAVVELTHPKVLLIREAAGRAGLALELGSQTDFPAVFSGKDLLEGHDPHAVVLPLAVVGQPDKAARRRDAPRVSRVGCALRGVQLHETGVIRVLGVGHVNTAGTYPVGHVAALEVDLLFGHVGVALGHQPVSQPGDTVLLAGVSEEVTEHQRGEQMEGEEHHGQQGRETAHTDPYPFSDPLTDRQIFLVFHHAIAFLFRYHFTVTAPNRLTEPPARSRPPDRPARRDAWCG